MADNLKPRYAMNAPYFETELSARWWLRLVQYYEFLLKWNDRLHLVAPCSPKSLPLVTCLNRCSSSAHRQQHTTRRRRLGRRPARNSLLCGERPVCTDPDRFVKTKSSLPQGSC
jgi:hypothetical protein